MTRAEQLQNAIDSYDIIELYKLAAKWWNRGALVTYQQYDGEGSWEEDDLTRFYAPTAVPNRVTSDGRVQMVWHGAEMGKGCFQLVAPADLNDDEPMVLYFFVPVSDPELPPRRWRVNNLVPDALFEEEGRMPEVEPTEYASSSFEWDADPELYQ